MWEEICKIIAKIVELFYFLAHDWGMAIILLTIVFRLLIMPLMLKQTKSSFMMQKVQPRLKEIQERYKDDPVRMQEETQKLYADAKFNPVAGCVPMLIQMPIFIALFQVLRNIQDFLPQYEIFTFYNIIPNLLATPAEVMEQGIMPFIPYGVLIVIFVGATFLPMLLQQKMNQDSQQKNQMYMMSIIMSVMMLFVSWSSPAGVLLFWGVSGIIATITQQVYMRHLRKQSEEEELQQIEVMPVQVEVERRVKKKRPTKKK
jgi:YidC/Oxa1 family membrane protein insertase